MHYSFHAMSVVIEYDIGLRSDLPWELAAVSAVWTALRCFQRIMMMMMMIINCQSSDRSPNTCCPDCTARLHAIVHACFHWSLQLATFPRISLPLYMRCSDVTELTILYRRHIGGTLDVNKEYIKIRKSENSCTKIICRPCTSPCA